MVERVAALFPQRIEVHEVEVDGIRVESVAGRLGEKGLRVERFAEGRDVGLQGVFGAGHVDVVTPHRLGELGGGHDMAGVGGEGGDHGAGLGSAQVDGVAGASGFDRSEHADGDGRPGHRRSMAGGVRL